MKFRIFAAALALVLCFGVLCGCSGDNGKSSETTAAEKYTGTGETLERITGVVAESGDPSRPGLDWDELYKDMTPEEIEQFEQDLKDLGWTKEDIENLLYYDQTEAVSADETTGEPADTSAAATVTETAAETTAK